MLTEKYNFDRLRTAFLAAMRAVGSFILNEDLSKLAAYHDVARVQKAADDLTRELDVRALELIYDQLRINLPATRALLVSEENPLGELLHGGHDFPELLFIIDPIDNADGAAHGDAAFSAITAYSRHERQIIAAAVCDPYLSQIYYSDESLKRAVSYPLNAEGPPDDLDNPVALEPSKHVELDGAFISMYTLKAERFARASGARSLLTGLGVTGRVQNIGGSASLCRVAAGYLDAAIEFDKGFQVYDLFPGAYILTKAGGVCAAQGDLNGLSLKLSINRQEDIKEAVKARQKFIGAPNFALFHRISMRLAQDNLVVFS